MTDRKATIPARFLFSWESQEKQFEKVGPKGLSYEEHFVPSDDDPVWPVDCVLWRNTKGHLTGILYHYPEETGLEKAGNVNIWVRPDRQGRGIGTRLVQEALRRWPWIDLDQQRYTEAGLRLAAKIERMSQ